MERIQLSLNGRKLFALTVVAVVFVFLAVGLIKLQVVEHEKLARQSEYNRIRVVPISARRGTVYDREGRVIIDNRPSYTVAVVPAEEVRERTVANLASLIGWDTTLIRKRIKRNTINRYQPAVVKQDIPFEAVAVLEEQNRHFPGVGYQMDRVRKYLDLHGVEAFTGYVGEVTEEQLARGRLPADYRPGSTIGKKGLEKQYDEIVRGTEGTAYIEVTASGQILGPYQEKEPVDAVAGADLHLTIDLDLQQTAVSAIDTFCCGAVVAMDPRTGGVLAIVSYPGFDPNIFSSVIPESLWNAIRTDSTHPLLNRPLNGLYPPASTTKLITIGAGLEEGLITENTTFKSCIGGYQFGNRFFRCWKPAGHGTLDAVHSIEQSCDVYLYQLGLKLGIDRLSDYFAMCGFGRVTGIDLPGESDGLNPNSAYYNERYGKNKWTRGLVLNNSIGQGELLTTPVQLAQFFCGIANHGRVYQPHLLHKIDGNPVDQSNRPYFDLPFSDRTLALLNEGLRLVVEGKDGTAKSLFTDLYSIGGKTGTAQNPHGAEHSWFVGVAPMDNPQIVVCAIIENAGHGSEVAAPVVGRIIGAYMNKQLGIDELAQHMIEGRK
jgi:penicillin-binding protein 2